MLCQIIPGASGLVWPPQVLPFSRQAECEDLLARHATAWLWQGGAKLGQALLPPSEAHLAVPLERNGFAHITRLHYLRRSCRASDRSLPPTTGITFLPYDPADPDRFHRTLLDTYADTLDCPEVNGVRDLGEIISGHRAQDTHAPARWWLALEERRPAGVLLMAEVHEWSALDVAYVGVAPEFRRRGVGRQLMAKALSEALAAGVSQVTLSVDERNQPARNLYRALGFETYDHREVYLALWGKPSAGTSSSLDRQVFHDSAGAAEKAG
jgi:ribosomal protein S18 acetylase RimI-like enzyme